MCMVVVFVVMEAAVGQDFGVAQGAIHCLDDSKCVDSGRCDTPLIWPSSKGIVQWTVIMHWLIIEIVRRRVKGSLARIALHFVPAICRRQTLES